MSGWIESEYFATDMGTLCRGDVMDCLETIPDRSVQCCVTSPPYYGLRDYGTDGQIGLEDTPEAFVECMVQVFREVRRVLRDDGTLWLNLGDSYANTPVGRFNGGGTVLNNRALDGHGSSGKMDKLKASGLKQKDLMMMPARVALALQADGWWLRSDIAWCKKSAMPESVTDRPTSAWEHIFLLSKSERYYYNSEAVKVPMSQATKDRDKSGFSDAFKGQRKGSPTEKRWQNGRAIEKPSFYKETGANLRNYWLLGPEPFSDAHFATYPAEIPRRAIKAGTRIGDTVLDPFMGSGTTAEVAQNLNRRWIGIELNPEYCAIAKKRISTRAAQRMLI